MTMFLRWIKVALVGCASWLIVCTLDDIVSFYVRRMTPFAESVLSATCDLHRKMLTLKGVQNPDLVVKTFGGRPKRNPLSPDGCKLIVIKQKVSGFPCGVEDASGYRVYDLPPIEDYRGYLVMRFSLDGNLQDYMVAYEGGADEQN